MNRLIFTLLVFMTPFASASTDYSDLLSATSKEAVIAAKQRLETQKTYELACDWELSSGSIPSHCFLGASEKEEPIEVLRSLNQLCKSSAQRQKSLRTLKKKMQVKSVSKQCFKYIRAQIDLLEYQNSEIVE